MMKTLPHAEAEGGCGLSGWESTMRSHLLKVIRNELWSWEEGGRLFMNCSHENNLLRERERDLPSTTRAHPFILEWEIFPEFIRSARENLPLQPPGAAMNKECHYLGTCLKEFYAVLCLVSQWNDVCA